MKKLFVLSAAAFFLNATVNAQSEVGSVKNEKTKLKKEKAKEEKKARMALRRLKGKEVSNESKTAFYNDFGNIPVTKWERTTNFDEATFTKDGQVMKAYYDGESKLVGTTTQKTFADIPVSAQKLINKKYKGYRTGDVIFFDDNEKNETDMIMYRMQFDDADNYFVDMKKDAKEVILKVDMGGNVSFFKQLK
jgi:hypothetical protein